VLNKLRSRLLLGLRGGSLKLDTSLHVWFLYFKFQDGFDYDTITTQPGVNL